MNLFTYLLIVIFLAGLYFYTTEGMKEGFNNSSTKPRCPDLLDETSYYVGTNTPLDQMNEKSQNMLYSPNPMDDNWGGADYTQSLVDAGYYKDDEVQIYIP